MSHSRIFQLAKSADADPVPADAYADDFDYVTPIDETGALEWLASTTSDVLDVDVEARIIRVKNLGAWRRERMMLVMRAAIELAHTALASTLSDEPWSKSASDVATRHWNLNELFGSKSSFYVDPGWGCTTPLESYLLDDAQDGETWHVIATYDYHI